MSLSRLMRPLLGIGLILAASGAGFYAWNASHPPAERRFEDIPLDEQEEWLQDLGYSD
jgi:hypothetical protein